MMRIKMTLELPIRITKKEKWYVAWCPALDVASQGDTAEEAKAHLNEALIGFLVSCLDHGTLDEVLRDCGFAPVLTEQDAEDDSIGSSGDKIHVPLYLLAKYSDLDQCHHV